MRGIIISKLFFFASLITKYFIEIRVNTLLQFYILVFNEILTYCKTEKWQEILKITLKNATKNARALLAQVTITLVSIIT